MSYVGKAPIDRTLGLSQKNTFTGDGSTTSFDMSSAAPQGGDTGVDVFVDNVRQEPGIGKAYVLAQDGSNEWTRITFSTAPASAAVIWTNNRLRTQITNILPGAGTINNTLLNDSVITGQTSLGATPQSTDTFLVYDASASSLKKVAYSNVHSGVADMAANTVKVRDAATSGAPSDKAVVDTQILIGDGTGFTAAALSTDVTMTNAGAVTIAADAVTYAKMQNLATANRVLGSASTGLIGEVQIATDMVADNAVTLAKMAGLVRGKIIVGDASGDPSALTVGTADQVLTSNGTDVSWSDSVGGASWAIKTGAYTAVTGDGVMVDTDSSAITITLPISSGPPALGDFVRVMDATGNAATNNITVARNGNNIQGAAADLTIATNRAAIGLVYVNATEGWVLIEN